MPPKPETVELIFKVLDRSEHQSPQALLQELQRAGVNQADAKEGLSYLINEEKLELTPSSELRRLHEAAA